MLFLAAACSWHSFLFWNFLFVLFCGTPVSQNKFCYQQSRGLWNLDSSHRFCAEGQWLRCWSPRNMHQRWCHVCVINLLLFLSGFCLESQCTLCGEPEGEWASPFPNSACHRHPPPCCSAFQGGREAGKRGGVGGGWLWCTHVVLQSSGQQCCSVSRPSG